MNGLNKTVFTIFGGTGDLTHRKLLPALFDLYVLKEITDDNFKIVIIGRRDYDHSIYRQLASESIFQHARFKGEYQQHIPSFLELIDYVKMDYNKLEDYQQLKTVLQAQGCRYLFYLAVAPSSFTIITQSLKTSQIIDDSCQKQLLIEKPFGDNLASAVEINQVIKQSFREDEIYRIDHYLAKEMIINILSIRFSNQVFRTLWNHHSIENIQITVSEQVGVSDRGGYYDQSGALKDMFQSHLIQMLTYVLMDEPRSMNPEDVHLAQEKVIEQLELAPVDTFYRYFVKGQYKGNETVAGYLQEPKIQTNSQTETYIALELRSHNPIFEDVPIYVRTGKRLKRQESVIAITFKKPQSVLAKDAAENVLIIRVSPDEGIYFKVNIKKPGNFESIESVSMDFCQSCIYENRLNTPQAYERLLLMALKEDQTLFTSWKMAQQSWELTEKIQALAQESGVQLTYYEPFSEGPLEADELLKKNGHHWMNEELFPLE